MASRKTDNAHLREKLALRRWFLDRYHKDAPFSVLDCCQGEQAIWTQLREEYPCRYMGVDLKPKPGRLKIDSVRILAQPGWDFDVVDIDTYGEPWRQHHWVRAHAQKSCTVFLTIGCTSFGKSSSWSIATCGVQFRQLELPPGLHSLLRPYIERYMMFGPHPSSVIPVLAKEAVCGGRTRYVGVRLEPTATVAQGPS